MNVNSIVRQSFGARYDVTRQDELLAERLKNHRLIMSPHLEWEIPVNPVWDENPFEDGNWQFQYHSLRWLDPLRRQGLKGDVDARELWCHYAKSWIEQNPAGNSPTKWAWIDMGDALRAYELVFAVPMFSEVPLWLLKSLTVHADWLADEKNLGHGNHALHQHQALFVVARALGNKKYENLALSRLDALAESSYDHEGINEEGSIAYQEANYHWWNEAMKRLDLEGIARPNAVKRIAMAPESLAHATQPNGQYVRIGDMDGGSPAKIDAPSTRYVSTAGAEGVPPIDLIKVYERGYVFGRSGWGETERDFANETFFSLCFGKQQKIHGHADGGSITYYSGGKPWLIDTGKFTYGRHPMRTYVLGRDGHNVLVIKDRKPTRKDISLFRQTETPRHFEAVTRDTSYDDVLITRRTIYSKHGEYLFIIDLVSSKVGVEVEQRWHVSEEASVTINRNAATLSQGDSQCHMQWVGKQTVLQASRGEVEPRNGWTSIGWRKETPTTVISSTQSGMQLTFRTIIGSHDTSQESSVEVRTVASGVQEYRVKGLVGFEYILISRTDVTISDFPFDQDQIDDFQNHRPSANYQATSGISELLSEAFSLGINQEDRRQLIKVGTEEMNNVGASNAYSSNIISTLIDIAGTDLEIPNVLTTAAARRRPMISWDPLKPSMDRTQQISSYDTRDQAAQSAINEGVLSYRFGNLTIPVATLPGHGDVLHVSFHGALSRSKYSLPRFERLQSLAGLNLPQLVFADPTLDLDPDLTLGWYLGTKDQDFHAEMAAFIIRRRDFLGLSHVTLSGSSGGGFAALQVSAFIPNSTVVAFNPQTDILSYYPRLSQKATSLVFPKCDLNDSEIAKRLNVAKRFSSLESKANIYFIQNLGDAHHDKNHRLSFLRDTKQLPGVTTETIFENWGVGHRSPDTDTYLRLIKTLSLDN